MEYRVFTLKLAEYLTGKGFKIIRTVQDCKKPEFLNWFFEATPELIAAIDEYQERRHRNL